MIESVLLLAGIVAVVLIGRKLSDTARVTFTQLLSRGTQREGTEIVKNPSRFALRADVDEIKARLLRSVQRADGVPLAIADAYLLSEGPDEIRFAYGTKLKPVNFECIVRTLQSGMNADVEFVILSWSTTDGVIDGVGVMKRLRADVEAALRDLDPEMVVERL